MHLYYHKVLKSFSQEHGDKWLNYYKNKPIQRKYNFFVLMQNIQACICFSVQRGFLFLLESLHQEEQLICFIRCKCRLPPLCDDERIEIRDGKGYFKKKELLKCLISKGELTCSEFLEMFRSYQNLYSQFCIAKQSVIQAGLSYI